MNLNIKAFIGVDFVNKDSLDILKMVKCPHPNFSFTKFGLDKCTKV